MVLQSSAMDGKIDQLMPVLLYIKNFRSTRPYKTPKLDGVPVSCFSTDLWMLGG